MRSILYTLFLSPLIISSCEKNNGGTVFDTYVDAIVVNSHQEDLLDKNFNDQNDYFDINSLKVIDANTGRESDLAPDKKSFMVISPEGIHSKYRLRAYLNPRVSPSVLYLKWHEGSNIDTISGIIESIGDNYFCTQILLNGDTVWTQSNRNVDRVITIVKSKQHNAAK